MAAGNNMSHTTLELPDLETEMMEKEEDLDETSKPVTDAAADVTDIRPMSLLDSTQTSTSNAVMKKKRKYKEYNCSYCGKYFRHKGNMQQHVRTHTQERPFSCNVCGMSFKKSSALLDHRRRHKGQGSSGKCFDCEICNRSFLSKNSLTIHLRVHSDEFTFSCKTCGKEFRHKSSLYRHSLIHTGDRKYSCDYCQRRFYDSSDMRKHLAIHTDYKKYQCAHCGKRFVQSSSYRTHLKVHSSDKKAVKNDVKVFSEYGQSGMDIYKLFEDNSDIEIVEDNSENESIDSVDEDEILHIARNLDKSCDSYSTNKLGQPSCTNMKMCSSDKPLEEECIKPSHQLETSFCSNNKSGTLQKSNSENEVKISETTNILKCKLVCVVKTDALDDEVSGKSNEREINHGGNSDNLIRMVTFDSMEENVINEHSKDSDANGAKTSASISNLRDEILIDNEIEKHFHVSGKSDAAIRKQAVIVDEVSNVERLARKTLADNMSRPELGKDDKRSSKIINVIKSNTKENIEVITNDNSQAVRTSDASGCFNTEKNVADMSDITRTDNAIQNMKIIPDKERSNREAKVGSSVILKEDVCSNMSIACTIESNDVNEKCSEDDRTALVLVSMEEPAHIGPIENLVSFVGTSFETPRNCKVHSEKQQGNSAALKQTRHKTKNENPDKETQSRETIFSAEHFSKIENTKPQSGENVHVEQNSNDDILPAGIIKTRKDEKSKEKVIKVGEAEKSRVKAEVKRCRHCQMFFESKTQYLQHLREHWKDKTFTCEDCLQSFVKWRDYSHHECNKTKPRKTKLNYVCIYCIKKFKTKEIWNKHMKRRKPCNDCKRVFCSSKDLISHSKTHLKKSKAFHYQRKHKTDIEQVFNTKFISFYNVASKHGCSEAVIEPYSSRNSEIDNLPSLSNEVDCHKLRTLENEGLSRSSKENNIVFGDDHGTTVSEYENYKVTEIVNNDKKKTVSTPSSYCDKGTSGSSGKLIISNKLFVKRGKPLTCKKLEISFKGAGKLKDKRHKNELDIKKHGSNHDNEEYAVETNINMTRPNNTVNNNNNKSSMNETTRNQTFVASDNFSKKNQWSDELYGSSVSDTLYFKKLNSSALKGQNLSTTASTSECCDKQSEEDEKNQSSSDSESTSLEEDDGSYEEVVLYKDLKIEGQGFDENKTLDGHFLNSLNEQYIEKVTPRVSVCGPLSNFTPNISCSVSIECKNKNRPKSAQRIKYNLRNKGKAQGTSEKRSEMIKTTDRGDSCDPEEDSGEGTDSASDDDSEGYEECTAEEVQAMLSGLP